MASQRLQSLLQNQRLQSPWFFLLREPSMRRSPLPRHCAEKAVQPNGYLQVEGQ